ncbi:dienelactone hydrolase [Biscogniauxia mediterranea]|nr:dienelactone hydrolase [Biscogniauxia mediterranea]
MEFNIPGIVNAAVPTRGDRNRNVMILSSNGGGSYNDSGFLSSDFPHSAAKLYVTAESDSFDAQTLREWRDEGFDVEYLPLGDGGAAYAAKLASLAKSNNLGPCQSYGLVAYGDAASFCLEHFHVVDNNPEFKLGCLVAYYPTRIPDPRGKFPSPVRAIVHLAAKGEDGIDVVGHSQMLGIQGSRRVSRRRLDRGMGAGRALKMAYPAYRYEAEPGFAEHDLDEYDKVNAELAWSRSVAVVRRALMGYMDADAGVVDQNTDGKFVSRNLGQTMETYTTHRSPHVTYMPTLTGAIDSQELQRFYGEFFLGKNPPSMEVTLVSRTVGSDRVVDELHVSFKHTQEMPWILPGVPSTNKRVEVMVVSIVTLKAGKICHEHVYWDQASVLVQVGLLDPKLVPQKASERGVKKLPVVGREAARRVLKGFEDEEDGEADNELIPGWYDDDDEEEEREGKENVGKEMKPKDSKGKQPADASFKPETRDQEKQAEGGPERDKSEQKEAEG